MSNKAPSLETFPVWQIMKVGTVECFYTDKVDVANRAILLGHKVTEHLELTKLGISHLPDNETTRKFFKRLEKAPKKKRRSKNAGAERDGIQ